MSAATVLLPGLSVTVIAGFAAVRLVRFFPARALVAGSFGAVGGRLCDRCLRRHAVDVSIMIAFSVLGLGIGLAETLTNDLMLSSVPPYKAGAASAISETAYEVGAVLGTAVLGSILTSTYRSHLTIPAVAQWGENDSSFETLAGQSSTPSNINGVGEAMLHSAHEAFDLGVQLTSGTAILVALAAAVVSWRTLKGA